MYLQTLKKTIVLPENWADNNYEGYSSYVRDSSSLAKTISQLITSPDVEVVSMTTEVSVIIKERQKEVKEELLDSTFWIDVASGKYQSE